MERSVTWLRVILVATVLTSIVHYTDNYVRFDEYPQDDPKLITQPMVAIGWVGFTVLAVAGWVLYRRGEWRRSAICLAIYSLSGLISPLHYLSGSWSEFDALQHTFILADAACGAAVLSFAVWAVNAKRAPGRPGALSEAA